MSVSSIINVHTCILLTKGVHSIKAWTQPASCILEKDRVGMKIMHIFMKVGGSKIKGGKKDLSYLSTYLHYWYVVFLLFSQKVSFTQKLKQGDIL